MFCKKYLQSLCIVLLFQACSSTQSPESSLPVKDRSAGQKYVQNKGTELAKLPSGISRYVPAEWSDLPNWSKEDLDEVWWLLMHNCQSPPQGWLALCPDIHKLILATSLEQRLWLEKHFVPYQIQTPQGNKRGLLTAYYEPILEASLQPSNLFTVPLYARPYGVLPGATWYSRQQIETLEEPRGVLSHKVIAWIESPIDQLQLHIQGAGRLRVKDKEGGEKYYRIENTGSNGHPYQSVFRWLENRGVKNVSWPGLREWARNNPDKVSEMMWSNPRYMFFQVTRVEDFVGLVGPRGARGTPLKAQRSVAVDTRSIPLGSMLWLSTQSPWFTTHRVVLAEDTGAAVVGSVRADIYIGSGGGAGWLAEKINQPSELWVILPRVP
ncbi:MAG: MltA domain-containing protein [Gammaproteobacteria bacterium]|nr:MltA domain-containing protein [Gammaproteobacteria bacterium]